MYLNTPSPKQIGKKGTISKEKQHERPVVSSELHVIIAHVLHSEDFPSHQTYFKMWISFHTCKK